MLNAIVALSGEMKTLPASFSARRRSSSAIPNALDESVSDIDTRWTWIGAGLLVWTAPQPAIASVTRHAATSRRMPEIRSEPPAGNALGADHPRDHLAQVRARFAERHRVDAVGEHHLGDLVDVGHLHDLGAVVRGLGLCRASADEVRAVPID